MMFDLARSSQILVGSHLSECQSKINSDPFSCEKGKISLGLNKGKDSGLLTVYYIYSISQYDKYYII